MVDVSIIIVNFNTKKLVVDCIQSIFEVDKEVKKEIIVIDNGSSDSSVEAIEKFLNCHQQIKARLIKNEENLGFAKANNQGISLAGGKYILLLNSDTKLKKYSVANLIKFAEKTPNTGVVGSKLLNPDGSVQPSVFRFPTVWRAIFQYWFGKKGLLDKYAPKKNGATKVDAVVGASFLITPRALARVGMLDEKYFMFYEDLDYCRRIWENGLKVYYLPESEIFHYHGASGKSVKDPVNQWRRLIPSSKIYHGTLRHLFFNFVIWSGQKLTRMRNIHRV